MSNYTNASAAAKSPVRPQIKGQIQGNEGQPETTPLREYIASALGWPYPAAGDLLPPGGAKVLLLTEGGVCITGLGLLAWSSMPKRNRAKEAAL